MLPHETVFACVDQPEHIVQWVEGAVEHTYISDRNPANPVGQRFRQRLRMGKSVKEFHGEIIAWEYADAFRASIPSPAYSSEAHFRISPNGPTRSTVDYSIDVTLHKPFVRLLSSPHASAFDVLRAKANRQAESLCGESRRREGGTLKH